MPFARRYALLLLVVLASACGLAVPAADPPAKKPAPKFTTETLRGKVVWLDEALSRLYGVATEPDAQHTSVVLEMADGRLWPIVPDTRGRSFLVDERLRDLEIEVLARRYDQVPMIQVIRVFRDKPEGRVEIDYWCDICAIPMYILKPCECCQGETRLREQPAPEEPK